MLNFVFTRCCSSFHAKHKSLMHRSPVNFTSKYASEVNILNTSDAYTMCSLKCQASDMMKRVLYTFLVSIVYLG